MEIYIVKIDRVEQELKIHVLISIPSGILVPENCESIYFIARQYTFLRGILRKQIRSNYRHTYADSRKLNNFPRHIIHDIS